MAKRERDVDDEQQQHKTRDLVSCLMLLSKADQNKSALIRKRSDSSGRVFICKTCDREFTSFQALGGHRASHKKPKQMMPAAHSEPLRQLAAQPSSVPVKPRAHECPVCGVEFAIGQALGGHMRRHRDVMSAAEDRIRPAAVPVLKKSNTSKRVSMSCVELDLDLNLAPPGYDLIS